MSGSTVVRPIRLDGDGGKVRLVLGRDGAPIPAPARRPPAGTERRPRTEWSDLSAALADVGAERDWFAEGAIEGDPLALFVAPEKSGKSWALMQLAVAAVTGGAWLGRFPIRRRGSAVLLDGEYGQTETARRLARIARGMGHDPRAVLSQVRHFHSAGLRLVKDDPLLLGVFHDLKANPAAVVIIDPLRNHLAGSENESEVALDALWCCQALCNAAGCPVIIAHHLNKSGGTSGSRALLTRADLVIEGSDEEQPWYRTRGRTVRQGDAIATPFTVEIRHTNDDDDRVARTQLAARLQGEKAGKGSLSKSAHRMLDAVRNKTKPTSVGTLRKITNQNDAVAKRALGELEAAGLAEQRGGFWLESTKAFFDALDPTRSSPKEGTG